MPTTNVTSNRIILYRYMTWAAFESTIEQWALKATNPAHTNDITEFLPAFSHDYYIQKNALQYLKEDIVFISFTKKMSCCAMWGHYAENFKGVCLAFCFPKANIRKVRYGKSRVEYSETSPNKNESFTNIITTKSLSWRYENEYRLLIHSPLADIVYNNMLLFQAPMKYLVGVILGVNCPYSIGYTKALLRKHAVDKKTIANMYNPRFVSLSYIDDNEFAIRSHVWHDNMTIGQLRENKLID